MKQVLLIEPDRELTNIYQTYLENQGYKVVTSKHAQDAVHLADKGALDLIILELQLAGHNGVEFLYEFRSYPEWQNVPILVLTMVSPHALMLTPEMFEKFGIARCLYKPATTLQTFGEVISNILPTDEALPVASKVSANDGKKLASVGQRI